jgi:hypothetical protein
MHREALKWVHDHAPRDAKWILDIGGRNVNGTPRGLFKGVMGYRVVDIVDGPEVDICADAATWVPDRQYDLVLACEVFEHARRWVDICFTASLALRSGGVFVATMAGPGRQVHSGIDGLSTLHPGETYENVAPETLRAVLENQGWQDIVVDYQENPADTRCRAVWQVEG